MRRICLSLILVANFIILSAQGWEMDNFYFNPSGIPSMPFAQIRFNDIDNDGDYDIWLGNSTRPPIFLENNGSATNPSYTLGYDYLEMILIDYSDMAVSVDLDGDGILDLVTGGHYGVYFWKCIDPETGTYTLQSGMFEDLVTGYYPIPDLADIDGDGDLDMILGFSESGVVKLYINTGSSTNGVFSEENSSIITDVGLYAYPIFCDFDNDGDQDILIGRDLQNFVYFKNIGDANNPVWEELSELFAGLGASTYWNSGDLADINGDGKVDIIYGTTNGTIFCYLNIGTPEAPVWQEHTSLFGGTLDVGGASSPFFIDFDGDGDLDMLSGTQMGNIKYFRNEGSIYHPIWQEDNSFFSVINQTVFSSVTAGDINGDGLPDVIIGDLSGNIYLYRNLGTSLQLSPFYFTDLNFGPWSCPRLVDMDMDGDLDLVVGGVNGTLAYLENTGDALSPNWTLVNGFFEGINVGYQASPSFADLDEDGDLDLVIGNGWGEVVCYEREDGIWQLNSTLLDNIQVDENAIPALVDLDHDGDYDLVVGDFNGTFTFFRNLKYSANVLNPPLNLDYDYVQNTDHFMVSWDNPEAGSSSPFLHYNVYMSIDSNTELLGSTNENMWHLGPLEEDVQYLISVKAQYIAGESVAADTLIWLVNNQDLVQNPVQLMNYPNPFNPATTISFQLDTVANSKLEVFNLKGQKLRDWTDLKPGINKVIWDGRDASGKLQGSGVYLYKLSVNGKGFVGKMIMLK